jgi:hypothetical protein
MKIGHLIYNQPEWVPVPLCSLIASHRKFWKLWSQQVSIDCRTSRQGHYECRISLDDLTFDDNCLQFYVFRTYRSRAGKHEENLTRGQVPSLSGALLSKICGNYSSISIFNFMCRPSIGHADCKGKRYLCFKKCLRIVRLPTQIVG